MNQMTYAVTGVASGIGADLARILRERGHRVIGFDITETDGVDYFVPLDLGDETSIDRAAAALSEPLDGLCNNAGISPRQGREAQILQVNFLGQRRLTQALLPHLKKHASIVNMASRAGHGWRENVDQVKRLSALRAAADLPAFVEIEGLDATRAYNLSKEAMILWSIAETEPMISRGIRINSLSPGAIATGILDDFSRAYGEKMARNVERAGRPGKPEEIARIAAFALSDESAWLKGTDIAIDGGMGAFALTDTLGLQALQIHA
jgi:NAD(P)-dependent dehydrogenase (short-subunit alcohol dehydrogenase family)